MTGPKQTARSYSAASNVSGAVSPLDYGDKCFLCSRSINIDTPPVDSREFYISKNGGMYLCHSHCLAEMNTAGGTPKAYHQARQKAGKPAVEPEVEKYEPKPPVQEQGPGWLHFDNLQDYNAYVKTHTIPESSKITVGNQLLQAGE